EIPNQVRNDNYKYRHLLSKKPFQYGFTFSSLLAVLLIITLLGKTDPAQLLASLPFADQLKVSSQKSEVDSQVLQSATTRRDFALRISVPVEMLSTASVSGNLTAPNILYSVLPGDNITISGDPQNPTISAVVEDLEQLGLVAGNGISFDGTTIT